MWRETAYNIRRNIMGKNISVAIDGPSGAGKSTLARRLAAGFGFIYVDTGAIYRTVGYAAQEAKLNSKDAAGIEALLPTLTIAIDYDEAGEQRMLLNGADVSKEIRTPKSSIYASDVSTMPAVRAFLLEMQRSLARTHNVVMDGRDIGTVVLPDAGLKIFLTASAQERARRRCLELKEKGMDTPFDQVLRDIEYRDEQDTKRAASPLKKAEDAVTVDTTGVSFEKSYEMLAALVRDRFGL
jgi:cytidylate kinase